MPKLFGDEQDGESEKKEDFSINKDYAKNYESWRHKEELHKCTFFYNKHNKNKILFFNLTVYK